ncbi:unnamed protein product, partial [Choristocarpus tenellus]
EIPLWNSYRISPAGARTTGQDSIRNAVRLDFTLGRISGEFGNRISFSNRKTRRTWKPNVQLKRLWSETLERWIKFHVTTHALRCVDHAGGLDRYET